MRNWRPIVGFVRVEVLDSLRFWQISMFSVALTSFYYAMLTSFVPAVYREEFTIAFVILAVLGVSFFNFGTRAAGERISPWNSYLRTLPAPLWVRFVARLIYVLLVASFSAILLVTVGAIRFDLVYDLPTVLTMVVAVPIATLVFAPLAACVGGSMHPRVAPAIMTIVYLSTAWTSGLWSGGRPPRLVESFDVLLPLFAVRRLAESIVGVDPAGMLLHGLVAALWTAVGLFVARLIHLRDEGEKFA